MMKTRKLLFVFAFLIQFWSCEKNAKDVLSGERTFSAHFVDTKTAVSSQDGKILWQPGDKISVLFGQQNILFRSSTTEESEVSLFKGVIDLSGADQAKDKLLSVYPYMESVSLKDGKLYISMKSTQKAVSDSFDPSSLITVAQCGITDNNFMFKHLCGGLRFKVNEDGIKKISFHGHNDETLAGSLEVSINEDGTPYVSSIIEPERVIVLECNDGFIKNTWYYMSMLPADLTKGFSVTLHKDDCTMTYYSNKATSIKRAIFGQIPELDKGLIFENDWTKNDFVHRSLLYLMPNCDHEGFFVNDLSQVIVDVMAASNNGFEAIQMFGNGPDKTLGIGPLIRQLNISVVPYHNVDYRVVNVSAKDAINAKREKEETYGTLSGISINSFLVNDVVNIETTLYFKRSGTYRMAVFITENDTQFSFWYRNQSMIGTMNHAHHVMRYIGSDVLGDEITVNSDNVIKYRFHQVSVQQPFNIEKYNILVYILRNEGGDFFVDNALSARVGYRKGLPLERNINSTIEPLIDSGPIR